MPSDHVVAKLGVCNAFSSDVAMVKHVCALAVAEFFLPIVMPSFCGSVETKSLDIH
jgi:hypothetical protein